MDTVKFRDSVEDLLRHLTAEGYLTGRTWAAALHEVPRHLFVPDRAWAGPQFPWGTSRTINRRTDPADWWRAIYTDCAISIQRDDGATDVSDTSGMSTSSLSAPGIAFKFLELLDPRAHDRILEIGTGTGWTAAVLSWRVGARNVTTIEIDKQVADHAAIALQEAGYEPHLVIGDGADGWPDGAPYDGVHVTCGVREIPHAWVEQTRPGGVIVLPWLPGWPSFGHQLRLDVLGDGSAAGRLFGPCGYTMLRAQRRAPAWEQRDAGAAGRRTTRLDPRNIVPRSFDDAAEGAALAVLAQVPDLIGHHVPGESGRLELRLTEPDGSWATCGYRPGAAEFPVAQHGARRLWDEVEAAHLRWLALGRPGRDRFGLTVTAAGQRIWLDTPGSYLA